MSRFYFSHFVIVSSRKVSHGAEHSPGGLQQVDSLLHQTQTEMGQQGHVPALRVCHSQTCFHLQVANPVYFRSDLHFKVGKWEFTISRAVFPN